MAQLRGYSFGQLDEIIARSRYGNPPIGRNTRCRREGDDVIGVQLHHSTIARLHRDGRVHAASCCWHTVTTKDRITSFIPHPATLVQRSGCWYTCTIGVWDDLTPWPGSATFSPEGEIIATGDEYGRPTW